MRRHCAPAKQANGMIRIKLPRMQIKNYRQGVAFRSAHITARDLVGIETKIGATGNRNVSSPNATCRDGKFQDWPRTGLDNNRSTRKIGDAIAPIANGKDRRIVENALFG